MINSKIYCKKVFLKLTLFPFDIIYILMWFYQLLSSLSNVKQIKRKIYCSKAYFENWKKTKISLTHFQCSVFVKWKLTCWKLKSQRSTFHLFYQTQKVKTQPLRLEIEISPISYISNRLQEAASTPSSRDEHLKVTKQNEQNRYCC